MEKLFGAPITETVKGAETHSGRRAYYTHAELGQALAGLGASPDPDRPVSLEALKRNAAYLAAMYSFALDSTVRPLLYHALREKTAEIARQEEWPERIPGVNGLPHHYEDELTALVLDVDWLKPLFQLAWNHHRVNLYAVALDVTPEIWQVRLLHFYVRILMPYESWLARARGHVERQLSERFAA